MSTPSQLYPPFYHTDYPIRVRARWRPQSPYTATLALEAMAGLNMTAIVEHDSEAELLNFGDDYARKYAGFTLFDGQVLVLIARDRSGLLVASGMYRATSPFIGYDGLMLLPVQVSNLVIQEQEARATGELATVATFEIEEGETDV